MVQVIYSTAGQDVMCLWGFWSCGAWLWSETPGTPDGGSIRPGCPQTTHGMGCVSGACAGTRLWCCDLWSVVCGRRSVSVVKFVVRGAL